MGNLSCRPPWAWAAMNELTALCSRLFHCRLQLVQLQLDVEAQQQRQLLLQPLQQRNAVVLVHPHAGIAAEVVSLRSAGQCGWGNNGPDGWEE